MFTCFVLWSCSDYIIGFTCRWAKAVFFLCIYSYQTCQFWNYSFMYGECLFIPNTFVPSNRPFDAWRHLNWNCFDMKSGYIPLFNTHPSQPQLNSSHSLECVCCFVLQTLRFRWLFVQFIGFEIMGTMFVGYNNYIRSSFSPLKCITGKFKSINLFPCILNSRHTG